MLFVESNTGASDESDGDKTNDDDDDDSRALNENIVKPEPSYGLEVSPIRTRRFRYDLTFD